MLKNKTSRAGRLEKIDRIFRELPHLVCKQLCQECCGPVSMSEAEWKRITDRLGYTPHGDTSLICPMLCKESGCCTVYDIRPLICRLWGLVKDMRCPWGCEPDRWLTDEESHALLGRVMALGR